MTFRAGLVQLTAGTAVTENIRTASTLIREAAGAGADFISTPEVTSLMQRNSAQALAVTRADSDDLALRSLRTLADELGVWLHIGSLPIRLTEQTIANRSFLLDPKGRIAASYDKIHMFDVTLPGGESIRESKVFRPGARAVTAPLPWGKLGLSICYDLRFPHLYRSLAKAGADILTVPAAFTRVTGQAHWHVLLRARAIETGSFVLAAGQCGDHEDGRKTFGHSLIVNPWGEVLADGGTEPGIVTADIDVSEVATARAQIPALAHDRPFTLSDVPSLESE
ncbi:MAG: carbon-nitrogen hydrolase family protein [Alphaproteobacteria bacterium]